jgi:hypothetical protein
LSPNIGQLGMFAVAVKAGFAGRAFRDIFGSMAPYQSPKLGAEQRKDGSWYAEASWPNAPTEDVGYFTSEAEACEWIATKAYQYFLERSGAG